MYDHVIWPFEYDPKISAIYALTNIDVNAPPEVVWKLPVDAKNWSRYLPPRSRSKFRTGTGTVARNKVQPGDLRFSDVSHCYGIRAWPPDLLVDDRRRRQDRLDCISRLCDSPNGDRLPCALRGDPAGAVVPRTTRAQTSKRPLQLSPGLGRGPAAGCGSGSCKVRKMILTTEASEAAISGPQPWLDEPSHQGQPSSSKGVSYAGN